MAMGGVYAVWMALLAWGAGSLGVGRAMVDLTARAYPGYRPTFLGGVVGAFYGFLTGFSLGWFMARIYNSVVATEPARETIHPVR